MPKVLIYNWVQFDNKQNTGGGVNVYLRNLLSSLCDKKDNEIYFLSSGWKYNPLRSDSYIEKSDNIYNPKIHSFEIVNSAIIAPAYVLFDNIEKYIYDEETLNLFIDFVREQGPFDVIHLHNIEGISVNVLKIKEIFPNTKIILSVHNYLPICPLVQYFQNHKNCVCSDYKEGVECQSCSVCTVKPKELVKRFRNYFFDKIPNAFLPILKFPLRIMSKFFAFKAKDYLSFQCKTSPKIYKKYREYNIEMINKFVDVVLVVSKRVGDILVCNGIDKSKIRLSYIGTKFADEQLGYSVAQNTKPFTIAYLGYERIDKGFFFMVESLSKLDKEIAKNVNVVLAVANLHKKNIDKLKHFNKVIVKNGYKHSELLDILRDVNLGIVPVIWEDNLPQVAIEMVACGVPILCSDLGGASELCSSSLFKFKGGDEKDFLCHLTMFIKNPELLHEYWNNHKGLTTMDEHISQLENFYK